MQDQSTFQPHSLMCTATLAIQLHPLSSLLALTAVGAQPKYTFCVSVTRLSVWEQLGGVQRSERVREERPDSACCGGCCPCFPASPSPGPLVA